MSTFSFQADKKLIQEIKDYFNGVYTTNEKSPYISYIFKANNAVITVYTSDKIVITGKDAETYNTMFNLNHNETKTNKDAYKSKTNILPQAGSDEVGTGDFFGPICVCATYIDESIYNKIKELKLDDSKKLTDSYICEVAPKLIRFVPHSLLILPNTKYNEIYNENNMNRMKAKLHNQCYLHLIKKGITLPELVVIDDFCGEEVYYKYLKDVEAIRGIHFETKAESKYISVAIGSMISRYAFLQEMDEMGKKYGMEFPKGAGQQVDLFGKKFVQKYGYDELYKVAKMNFRNKYKIEDLL